MNTLLIAIRQFRAGLILVLAAALLACAGPTMDEQRAQILNDDIRFEQQTVQAFLDAWGKPTYIHRERMQFFILENGNSLPRFRVPMGEAPQDWTTKVLSEDSVFFGYPDRGELLGFVDGWVIYREHVATDVVHTLGKNWEREERFKTRLETPASASPR